jgi:hypothetical protein
MNKSSMPQPPLRPLHQLIQTATGAKSGDFAQIENIMRDEIFHSTLDWQTREQLSDAARQAYAILTENREQYEMRNADCLAVFHQMRAESVSN